MRWFFHQSQLKKTTISVFAARFGLVAIELLFKAIEPEAETLVKNNKFILNKTTAVVHAAHELSLVADLT